MSSSMRRKRLTMALSLPQTGASKVSRTQPRQSNGCCLSSTRLRWAGAASVVCSLAAVPRGRCLPKHAAPVRWSKGRCTRSCKPWITYAVLYDVFLVYFRLLDTHLWWPQAQGSSAHKAAAAAATAGTTSSTSAKHQLVQESLAQDRLLQHQGRGRGWRASGRYKSKKEYQADQELAAGRGLATMLLGDPRNIHQQHPPTNSRSMVHLASPCGGDLQDWVCCNKPYPDNALEPTRLTEAVARCGSKACVCSTLCCHQCRAVVDMLHEVLRVAGHYRASCQTPMSS